MSKIVYKQWIYQPNKRRTPKIISNMVQYIATRPGVEHGILPLSDELKSMQSGDGVSKELYAQYIATRPGVAVGDNGHGLFGKLHGMNEMGDIEDLELTRGYIENLCHEKKTIYNAVISMKIDDAMDKDMTTRNAWAKFIDSKINDISREMGINPRTMEWVAAVHLDKKRPHLHLMYWDSAQTIGVNFIEPERADSIRKSMIHDMYHDEFKSIMQVKDEQRKELIGMVYNDDESLLKKEIATFPDYDIYQMAKQIRSQQGDTILDRRTADINVPPLLEKLVKLRESIRDSYKSGALKYKYLPPELKLEVDKITDFIIKSNPDIASKYRQYLDTVKEQAAIYGGTKNIKEYVQKAKEGVYTEIGNKVLSCVKSLNQAQFKAYAEYKENKEAEWAAKVAAREKHYQHIAVMQLMQSALSIIADYEVNAGHTRQTGHDLTKSEKKQLAKEHEDNSIDWR